MKKVENAPPVSSNKSSELLTTLGKNHQIRTALKVKVVSKQQQLNDGEKKWIWELLDSANISYMNPGRKDNI